MFGSLIRRKNPVTVRCGSDDAFESTTFSLSTAVPRPIGAPDRRAPHRHAARRQADAMPRGCEQLIRVRNVSAGGLMAECSRAARGRRPCHDRAFSRRISRRRVVWIRDGIAGFKFDQNIDLGELLAGRKPRHGFRPRPPRLEVNCKAMVKLGKTYYTVDVHDISLGGMKVEPIEEYCLGKQVVVVVESLRPIRGEVRWFSDRKAGIVFDQPLKFEELAEWVGKRLEIASAQGQLSRTRPSTSRRLLSPAPDQRRG